MDTLGSLQSFECHYIFSAFFIFSRTRMTNYPGFLLFKLFSGNLSLVLIIYSYYINKFNEYFMSVIWHMHVHYILLTYCNFWRLNYNDHKIATKTQYLWSLIFQHPPPPPLPVQAKRGAFSLLKLRFWLASFQKFAYGVIFFSSFTGLKVRKK